MRYILIVMGLVLYGCDRNNNFKNSDSPTSGSIRIAVDESLKPLIEAEIKAFEGIYRNASIMPLYVSEADAVELLIHDSVRLAIITRSLTNDETRQIKSQKVTPHKVKVAREGIALIVNNSNTDTLWDVAKLKSVLGGGAKYQKVVFDNQNSGIARFIRDSLLHVETMAANSYAVDSNERVIDYITNDPKAVGLIGTSWISDRDDSVANRFLGSVKVVAIAHGDEHYQPYQAYIAQGYYPLTRDVIINSREARSGLGSGFISFVAGDKGQRVVLKAGLVPVTMPIRLVEIRRESL